MLGRLCLVIVVAGSLLAVPAGAETGTLADADALLADVLARWPSGPWQDLQRELSRAITIRGRINGQTDPELPRLNDLLARVSFNMRQWATAATECRTALLLAETTPIEDRVRADILGDLAAALREQGRLKPALDAVEQSLALRRGLVPFAPRAVIASLQNRALIRLRAGDRAAALDDAREAEALASSAFGLDSPIARQMRMLATDVQARPDPWRGTRTATVAALTGLALLFTARSVRRESSENGQHMASRVLALRDLLAPFGLALAGFGCFAASQAWVSPILASLMHPDSAAMAGKLRHASGMIGLLVAVVLGTRIIRLRTGAATASPSRRWPRLPRAATAPPADSSADMSVSSALHRGYLLLGVLPVTIMLLGFAGVAMAIRFFAADEGESQSVGGWTACLFVLPFVSAWLFWSVVAPRWRLWSMRRVRDWPLLKAHAIRSRLIWPDGNVFGRTEIRTARMRREIDALEAAWEAAPSRGETPSMEDARV